jgi:hypothetical protein
MEFRYRMWISGGLHPVPNPQRRKGRPQGETKLVMQQAAPAERENQFKCSTNSWLLRSIFSGKSISTGQAFRRNRLFVVLQKKMRSRSGGAAFDDLPKKSNYY